jgi:hypothetical protein
MGGTTIPVPFIYYDREQKSSIFFVAQQSEKLSMALFTRKN